MVAEIPLPDLSGDDARGLDVRAVTIPGSSPDVRLARLHVDPATRASVCLVRFPAGWSRPGVGSYGCAEEFAVLDGWIQVSGTRFGVGDYCYLPAGTPRADSRSGPGCLTVAWFSGPVRWTPGSPVTPARVGAVRARVGDARRPRDAVPGGCAGAVEPPAGPVDVPTEVLWVGARRWCLVPAGAHVPARAGGPVLVRWWTSESRS